jgi:hypothetical protein
MKKNGIQASKFNQFIFSFLLFINLKRKKNKDRTYILNFKKNFYFLKKTQEIKKINIKLKNLFNHLNLLYCIKSIN